MENLIFNGTPKTCKLYKKLFLILTFVFFGTTINAQTRSESYSRSVIKDSLSGENNYEIIRVSKITNIESIEGVFQTYGENKEEIRSDLNKILANELGSLILFADTFKIYQIVVSSPQFLIKKDTLYGQVIYELNYYKSDSIKKQETLNHFLTIELLNELLKRETEKQIEVDYDNLKYKETFEKEMEKLNEIENQPSPDKNKTPKNKNK